MPVNKIKVSVSDLSKRALVAITQGDSRSRIIEATVMDGGSPLDLTGRKARFRAELPHGKVVIDDGCEVADPESGAVVYTLSDEMAASPAVITNAYFEVYDDAGYSLAASKMVIEVGGGVDLGGARPSDYVPELDRLKAEARDAIVACEDAAAKANATASQAATDAQAAIAEVKATEAKLYPVAENILVGSETGAVAHVEDAFAGASLRKITVEGACKQDGIPSPDAPVPIEVIENPVLWVTGRNVFRFKPNLAPYSSNGISFTPLADGGIRVVGTATDTAYYQIDFGPGYYFSIKPFIGQRLFREDVSSFAVGYALIDGGNETLGMGESVPPDAVWWRSFLVERPSGQAVDKLVYPNVCIDKLHPYAPNTSQTLTLALPAEHPYLAKLPDGTADEIVVDEEGNVSLIARVSRVLPSKQKLTFVQGNDSFDSYVSFTFANDSESKKRIMSNTYEAAEWTTKSGYIYCPQESNIVIRDNRFTSEEQAKKLLDGVVVYVAVEPTRYSLGKIEMPKAQDSIVNAWTDAEVTPNTSISYVRDMNIVVANIESAIASITEG